MHVFASSMNLGGMIRDPLICLSFFGKCCFILNYQIKTKTKTAAYSRMFRAETFVQGHDISIVFFLSRSITRAARTMKELNKQNCSLCSYFSLYTCTQKTQS